MDKRMQNLLIAIVGSLLIITFAVLKIVDISADHKLDMEIAEACMDEGRAVVFESKHLLDHGNVSCE